MEDKIEVKVNTVHSQPQGNQVQTHTSPMHVKRRIAENIWMNA